MAKLKGSYKSLVRGVSEQVPHDRLEGQHYEQVNLVSDPIRGLIRRRGSKYIGKSAEQSNTSLAQATDYLDGFREHSFTAQGVDYATLYATHQRTGNQISPVLIYDKDSKKIVPTSLSPSALARSEVGLTSAVSVGRYLLFGTQQTPTVTATDEVEKYANTGSVWIRGGAYSRTYTLRVGTDSVSYTTPKSYYDGTLNTSDIPYDAPEYQKLVNDRVHEYNTAVNQYIAQAQREIQPDNIAYNLAQRINELGNPDLGAGANGPHVHVYGDRIAGSGRLIGSDGGDGSFMRVTHRTVSSLDDLTKYAPSWMVVAVEVSSEDIYYVQARPKDETGATYQEVTWVEATGTSLDVSFPFLIGTVYNGTFYLASSPDELSLILPSGHGLDVPQLVPRKAGDDTTSPRPDFFDRPISYMTVFQDRLTICSGANVFMSVPGDYFNWWRKSALRIDPDDPIEVYALGAEDDVIRGGSTIDRNLILIGDSLHYALSGREVITPTNAIVSVQSAHEATTDAAPQALGNLIFYSQYQGGVTKLHQMQVGAFADSFDNFSVTQQVTDYIQGRPRQLVTSSQPNMVLMSTEGEKNGVYVFTFLDSPGQEERLFDSWSRWCWDESLGSLMGMTHSNEGFVVFTYREVNGTYHVVADEFLRDSSQSDDPYLDSHVKGQGEGAFPDTQVWAALGGDHPRQFFGRPAEEEDRLLALDDVTTDDVYYGVAQEAFYEPTAPYIRDDNDNAVLAGRIVLSSLGISLSSSAGMTVRLQPRGSQEFDQVLLDDSGFRIADPLSPLGAVPLTDRRVTCYVGKEIREHRLRIAAKSWTPLNIATVEWVLQVFNRR